MVLRFMGHGSWFMVHGARCTEHETPRAAVLRGAFLRGAGDGLLSRVLSDGVPSAL